MTPQVADHGTLNGQPVGPELPAPVACPTCKFSVYVADRLVAYRGEDRVDLDATVWELDWLHAALTWPRSGRSWPPSPWALTVHVHRGTA
jgi:hypothetical protein